MLRLYKPAVFQGDLRKKNYFEGWYFKHVSADLGTVFSFIPGIALNESDPHAFIQVIDGTTSESEYLVYPVSSFSWKKEKLYVSIGNSVFTGDSSFLDICGGKFRIEGEVRYSGIVRFPVTLSAPGIMGWYSYVPRMECRHGIVSANHTISGSLSINSKVTDFTGGKGYIEKDWGRSFPESYLWIQANNFKDTGTSFSFSVAKIPWIGKFFIGFICFLYYKKKYYLYTTWNRSSITRLTRNEDSFGIEVKNKGTVLRIDARMNFHGELMAPVSGMMTRRIRESIDSEVGIELLDRKGNSIYAGSSSRAGFELIEKILEYFN